jgi:hypothetical protein
MRNHVRVSKICQLFESPGKYNIYNISVYYAGSVSNPVYTDTGIPVFGTPYTDTDTGKKWPVFAGICLYPILLVFTMQLAIIGLILSHNRASYCLSMYNFNI